MIPFIKELDEKSKKCQKLILQIPKWEKSDFKNYFQAILPSIYQEIYSNDKMVKDLDVLIESIINKRLENDIDTLRADTLKTIELEKQKLIDFLELYAFCSLEYGREIAISSIEDIKKENCSSYIAIFIPKAKLSLLCDKDFHVLKKNFLGHEYFSNNFQDSESPSFFEATEDAIYFYPSLEEKPLLVGTYDKEKWDSIGFLDKYISAFGRSDGTFYLFNENKKEIMIDDYDTTFLQSKSDEKYFVNFPIPSFKILIYKTLQSKETKANLVFIVNSEGVVITDVVDKISGRRYAVDHTISTKEAIAQVYENVLHDLEDSYKHTFLPLSSI